MSRQIVTGVLKFVYELSSYQRSVASKSLTSIATPRDNLYTAKNTNEMKEKSITSTYFAPGSVHAEIRHPLRHRTIRRPCVIVPPPYPPVVRQTGRLDSRYLFYYAFNLPANVNYTPINYKWHNTIVMCIFWCFSYLSLNPFPR